MTGRRPIGLTVPYREVGYQEKSGWVGLTEDEKNKILVDAVHHKWDDRKIVETIEAKLKEKNAQKK